MPGGLKPQRLKLIDFFFSKMGALLAKPIASTFRVWDLTRITTKDYLNTLSYTSINVYLFGNKPIRILPVNNWISDKLRFSFDGWFRQRLTNCFKLNKKISWFKALSEFTLLVVNKNISLHWSSVEPGLVLPFLEFFKRTSTLNLSYTNLSSSSELVDLNKTLYRWSTIESYPILKSRSILYKSENSKTLSFNLQPVLTSIEQTEFKPVEGSFNSLKTDITCLLQTEQLNSLNFIYFGTHGNINAQNALLSIPILTPYERTNSFTGPSIVKGPLNSRSLLNFVIALTQIYSKKSKSFTFENLNFKTKIEEKLLYFRLNKKKYLSTFREHPQLDVSPVVQVLSNFIKNE